MKTILISTCLLGENVRYDGEHNSITDHAFITMLIQEDLCIPVCPEVDGQMSIPRAPCEIECGFTGKDVIAGDARVYDNQRKDQTQPFILGAYHALDLAKRHGIKMAILKASSPSCSNKLIHDGTFSGVKKEGLGVTVALLEKHGVKVFSEKELALAEAYWSNL